MRGTSPVWARAAFDLTALALIAAACKARFSRGTAGAWWFGFALLGWAHFLLGLLRMRSFGVDLAQSTQLALETLIRTHWPRFFDSTGGYGVKAAMARLFVLHNLLSLLMGFVGAWIVWYFAGRAEPDGVRASPSRPPRLNPPIRSVGHHSPGASFVGVRVP